jgi:hypothetical protein
MLVPVYESGGTQALASTITVHSHKCLAAGMVPYMLLLGFNKGCKQSSFGISNHVPHLVNVHCHVVIITA